MTEPSVIKLCLIVLSLLISIIGYFAKQALRDIKRLDSQKASKIELKEYVTLNNTSLLTQITNMQDDVKYIRDRVDRATL